MAVARAQTCLVALPEGARIPPAVARITGISDAMVRTGQDRLTVWAHVARETARLPRPAPTVIHFARFERPFLTSLAPVADSPLLDVICTHEVARRLLPDLPRRSLRALAGYFGQAVGPLRRSADHVEATAYVWRALVALLESHGVTTWNALRAWFAAPTDRPSHRSRRVWPIARELRLDLPDAPGVYRLLRRSGDVLYIGKAVSLRRRVNSYFRHQTGVSERMLEMLTHARDVSFQLVSTALEAALLEPDEIKRHRPPYNIALTEDDRMLWFASADFAQRATCPSDARRVGPIASPDTIDRFAALAHDRADVLSQGRWGPDAATFEAGLTRLRDAHRELKRMDCAPRARLLRLGVGLWREGRRDHDLDHDDAERESRELPWTPELVERALEWIAVRAILARRRARWLTRLMDAAIVWREPGSDRTRLLMLERGDVVSCTDTSPDRGVPLAPGRERPEAEQRAALTLARYDRLRVVTTELKRVIAAGGFVAVHQRTRPALTGARLDAALSKV